MKPKAKMAGKKRPQVRSVDLVGIDFSTTATKVVRLKKGKEGVSLMGIDLLPAVDLGTPSQPLELPRNMLANYGCLACSGLSSVVRVVGAPLAEGETELSEEKLRGLLNVGEEFRVSATLLKRGRGRQDSSFLAAAMPLDDVRFFLNMFPAGPPAPASLEVSGLAFVPAFLHARGEECSDEAVCLIEAGESVSHFVFMNRGQVVLVGKFAAGSGALQRKVVEDLGVDAELARTILGDQSISVSSSLVEAMGPFLKQLLISKDFIERHQGCRVSKTYISGGAGLFSHWNQVLGQELHTEVVAWSPFEKIACDSGVLPASLSGQATRFSAAVGAALGGLLDS